MTTERQIAANRTNSQRSTGPTSEEGRARSSQNATKHGCFSKKAAFAREESYAFENRRMKWMGIADAQDDREEFLVYLNVCQSADFEHAQQAEVSRIERRIRNSDEDEENEVYKLGKRLFHDPSGPTPLYGIEPVYQHKKRTSGNGDPEDPNDPHLLVRELQRSQKGCEWLIQQWEEIRAQLEPGRSLMGFHRLKLVRLIGRQPVQAVEDRRVALIYVASNEIEHLDDGPFAELESDMSCERVSLFERNVEQQWPDLFDIEGEAQARAALIELVDQNLVRLDERLQVHEENAEATGEETMRERRVDTTTEGKYLSAHKKRCERAFHRGLEACQKYKRGNRDEGRRRRDDVDLSWAREAFRSPRAERDCVDISRAREPYPEADAGRGESRGTEIETCGRADGGVGDPHRTEEEDGTAMHRTTTSGGDGASDKTEVPNRENEANSDENVISLQGHVPMEVAANSSNSSGLDNVASLPRGGSELDEGLDVAIIEAPASADSS
jgi:hypothetical protein